ncbi:MAG: hydantoinase/oxoprolinase family protein [Gammaproteobacteria bacterium]|nr:hydantoinase/oxoprolinase family protein [Gammaproteobacteria bacterium]
MALLVNIDNGGTFTDICVSDGTRLFHAKSTTTPHDLTQCFIDVLRRAARDVYGDEDLAQIIRDTDYLRYSTTSATNAIVERKGTPVALLVERGEEDSVYGAVAALGDDTLWRAMVPERPVSLAVATDGSLDEPELTRAINQLLSVGVQRLVVALRTPAAENAVKDVLLERYPRHLLGAIPFLVSHELVDDPDDARRTITAVVNSYLHPGMEHFLYGAENICKQNHLRRPLLIFRNDGDSARVAKTTALKTWGSGPRGGLEGAIAYARLYGADTLIAMDIGGTTTDLSVVCDRRATLLPYGDVGSMVTSFPLPDLHSFGLGGSSVIQVLDGRIVIGPDSVGAAPGPACFGRGGSSATLTDALLLAGVIDPKQYLGGELALDAARAEQAIDTHVGKPLGLDTGQAVGVTIDAFAAQVGARLVAALKAAGRAPQDAVLLAFGGGGPMIVSAIAEAAGIRRVIVPHLAEVFSAFGIGFSNIAHVYQVVLHGDGVDTDALRADLESSARRDMYGEGVDPEQCSYDFSLWSVVDGRVREQPLAAGADVKVNGAGTRLTLNALYRLPSFALTADDGASTGAASATGTTAIRLEDGRPVEVAVYSDAALEPGREIAGPALLRGPYLTCLIRKDWKLRVTANGDLSLEGMPS